MARRLDEAIVSACRVPYQPGALEAMINLVVENAHGSGANFMRPADGATPLHAAAFVGDAQACRALLSLGADPALADAHGLTPYALARKLRETCASLLEDALQNRDAAYDYYYLDAVKRGDSAEAGIALEKAVADALGQGAAVVPACGETWTECDGYVLDDGAASSDERAGLRQQRRGRGGERLPRRGRGPLVSRGRRVDDSDDEVFDDSEDEGAPRFEAVQPA